MSEKIVDSELGLDLRQLSEAESTATVGFRVWSVGRPVVVVGRSVLVSKEVDIAFCQQEGIPVVERPSGGRSVLIGPGTVQYTFALPYSLDDELGSIAGSKAFCNRLLRRGSPELAALDEDESGDLVRDHRKIAGLALRRGRKAMLLHGSILVTADLGLIADALRHPQREPAYRSGRSHRDFLDNLGVFDAEAMNARVRELLALPSDKS
jgi:lipoate-protein ligase A